MQVRLVALGLGLFTVLLCLAVLMPALRASRALELGVPESTSAYLPAIAREVTPTPSGTPTPSSTPTPTDMQFATATSTPTFTPTGTATDSQEGTFTSTPTPTSTATPTSTETSTAPPLEEFEGLAAQWVVLTQSSGGGGVTRSAVHAADGAYSARAAVSAAGGSAYIYTSFSDSATDHIWQERPGSWRWQRARIWLPSATVEALTSGDSLTIAGSWPTADSADHGWRVQVRQGGRIWVDGFDSEGIRHQFDVYAAFPLDQWVDFEVGLHSQNGPGVKRAFALVLNGAFYGWYHQGRMTDETYDRAAFGVLATTANSAVELFVDSWYGATSGPLPGGPDTRPTTALQEIDYREQNGERWQIDWSTWGQNLRMDAQEGLYSATNRLQSGMNIDRLPDLTDGWAEIEIGWPQGAPHPQPNSYFGPMVGFRKEINREENLEVIPIGDGAGGVNLVFEAWVNGGPVVLAQWPMPVASTGGTHIPEAGDIIRARWDAATPAGYLRVRARYYDASAATWYDAIDHTFNAGAVSRDGAIVNFNDGYHTAASITIDSPGYSIRRFKAGTLQTAPAN